MEGRRRLTGLLGALVVSVAAYAYVSWSQRPVTGASGRPSSEPRIMASRETLAPDVHIEALVVARPRPGAAERDLFKFKPRYVPLAPAPIRTAPSQARPGDLPPLPAIPPIGLKFIGVLEQGTGPRIAVLSDGRGAPIYGREGEAVLGQYRILRIGAESIELEYVDGRGRQAIRMSGS